MTTSPLAAARPHRRLTRQQRADRTDELAWRAHTTDDPDERRTAQDELVEINLRVAHAVAARYRDRGVPLEDLEQVACEGLLKAVHRFDPTRHHDLLSYAVPTIRGEVLRYFRDLSWAVRPPRRIQELQWRITAASEQLTRELHRHPTTSELCTELGVAVAEHDDAVRAFGCFSPPSLDQPVDGGDGAVRLGDRLPDVEDAFALVDARTSLLPLLAGLSERHQRILQLRFVEDRTQQQIGDELGMTQVQVSRALTRILRTLHEGLEDELSDAS